MQSVGTNERVRKLNDYFKFTVLRNPPERLLSAYLDKFSGRPTIRSALVRAHVSKDKDLVDRFKSNRNYTTFTPVTFEEFVIWFVERGKYGMEEHTRTFMHIAQPCVVNFSYYVRFKNYSNDVLAMRSLIGGSHVELPVRVTNAAHANSKIYEYYGNLSTTLKNRLYQALYDDIAFYHYLEPEDIELNEKLLQVSIST